MISVPMASEKEVLTMTEYIENPLSGKLRGVTYEDGKIIDVHIRDTDDVVKVFVPVRHGRWIMNKTSAGASYTVCSHCNASVKYNDEYGTVVMNLKGANYCPNCGAKMDGRC